MLKMRVRSGKGTKIKSSPQRLSRLQLDCNQVVLVGVCIRLHLWNVNKEWHQMSGGSFQMPIVVSLTFVPYWTWLWSFRFIFPSFSMVRVILNFTHIPGWLQYTKKERKKNLKIESEGGISLPNMFSNALCEEELPYCIHEIRCIVSVFWQKISPKQAK